MGLGFLISVLRKSGRRVIFRDPYLEFDPAFPGADMLVREGVDLVGIYSNTVCFQDTLRMCRRLERFRREGRWEGRIAVGGPHASIAPDSLPSYVDHVVVGEGEGLIVDLAEGRAPKGITEGPLVEDLDSVPRPAYDLFSEMPYDFGHADLEREPVYMLNTSRGCSYACTFCSVRSVWGRGYRAMSAERVADDVEWLCADYGARGIYFREDHFTLSRERTRLFCREVLRRDLDVVWACESRADSLDPELLRLMHRAGCRWLYIGVESGSERMLERLRKEETLEDFRKAFRWCRRAGVRTYASFIVGVPGETPHDVLRTLQFADELNANRTIFNVFAGLPDSPLYREAIRDGLVEHEDENGLLYLKGHDLRTLGAYGPWSTPLMIPGRKFRPGAWALKWLYRLTRGWPRLNVALWRIMRRTLLTWGTRYLAGRDEGDPGASKPRRGGAPTAGAPPPARSSNGGEKREA